jgi:ADP-L-glycero-D-manno-heptose 6-epimerase
MIVVTGGAGFIGSNLVAALDERKERGIVVCDHFGRGEKWRNIARRELLALIPPDRLTAFLDSHAGEIEALVHLGAVSSTTEREVDLIVEQNVVLPQRLWDWCATTGCRFIYASSGATYGNGSAGFDDDGSPEALARLRPLNAYGWSKHLFDRWVARRVASGGPAPPAWAGLKFFNVYGPNEYHKGDMRSVAAKLYERIAAGKVPQLYRSHDPAVEDGGQKRDFVWVGDCVDVLLWLLAGHGTSGLYNVGSGRARSWLDLARAVIAAAGAPPDIEFVAMPPGLPGRYQAFTEARMERLGAAGYDRPFTTLEDGVGRYVRDFLATPDPYR